MHDQPPLPGPRRAGADRPRRHERRSQVDLILLILAVILAVVVAIAALRSDDGDPALVAVDQATATAVPPTDGSGFGVALDDDSSAIPTVAPTPSPTPQRTIEQLPLDGPGTFTYAPAAPAPIGAAPYTRFNVASEDGIGIDARELAAIVDETLDDQRSWIGDGVTGFQRVGPDEDVLFTLVVAAPTTVDRLCTPLNTASRYSCGRNGWIALNLFRWETAAEVWPSTLEIYRQYLVNHEVGHYLLGGNHDNVCPTAGGPAPIMMQQSILLDGCAPNGWVYPDR